MTLTSIMQIMTDPEKKVILDTDVIIHFIKGELLFELRTILSNELIILDTVYEEVNQRRQKEAIDRFLELDNVQLVGFPDENEYVNEYAYLRSTRGYSFGRGESACLAFARINHDVVASSNLKDIRKY